ncbi:hypothetical protein CA833_03270 [Novosphingobium sp. KA1]|nr:hypothetical protein CA833_03270 [Novosphingobium sp. KA1]
MSDVVRLDLLHRVIEAAMGREGGHLWRLYLHGVDHGVELGRNLPVPLSRFRLRAREHFSYVYASGDKRARSSIDGGERGDVAMTLRCTAPIMIELRCEDDRHGIDAAINRLDAPAFEVLGLIVAAVHPLRRNVRARLIAALVGEWQTAQRARRASCAACGPKDFRPVAIRIAFDERRVRPEQLRCRGCGSDAGPDARATLLPIRLISMEGIRRQLHAVAERQEEEREFEEGNYMEQPDGPVILGIKGAYVRDRDASWF